MLPKVLYFGAKQGPGIFQSLTDSVFGRLKDSHGKAFASAFVDDINVSTEPLTADEDFDTTWEHHLDQLCILCDAAAAKCIQFKFEKSMIGYAQIPMLGFVVGEGKRTVQPGKQQALRPCAIGRIRSHLMT